MKDLPPDPPRPKKAKKAKGTGRSGRTGTVGMLLIPVFIYGGAMLVLLGVAAYITIPRFT